MKNEKRIILYSILALTIGIASIAPLAIFTAKAQTVNEPWFNIDLAYAYFNAENIAENIYRTTGATVCDASINSNVLSQHIDARAEYFEFKLYTDDDILLSKSHNCIVMDKLVLENPPPTDENARPELWFNIPWLTEKLDIVNTRTTSTDSPDYKNTIPNNNLYIYDTTNLTPEEWQKVGIIGSRTRSSDETSEAILAALKDTQTIYLDIRRVACITTDDKGTVTISECDQLIQHVKLTKNSNNEFTFGNLTSTIEERLSEFAQMGPKDNTYNGQSGVISTGRFRG